MRVVLVLAALAAVAQADPLRTDPIELTIAPAKHTWHGKAPVDVVLTATNITHVKHAMKVMSCSWDQQVRSSDLTLDWEGWDCTKNGLVTIELAPGEKHTWTLKMFAKDDAKPGAHKFRLIMTPRDGDPMWSNLVTVEVDR